MKKLDRLREVKSLAQGHTAGERGRIRTRDLLRPELEPKSGSWYNVCWCYGGCAFLPLSLVLPGLPVMVEDPATGHQTPQNSGLVGLTLQESPTGHGHGGGVVASLPAGSEPGQRDA